MEVSLEILDYVGDDEAGAYCEALRVGTPQGNRFVMHRGSTDWERQSFVHKKMEFSTREALLKRFPASYSKPSEWTETDSGCGYAITTAQHQEAMRRRENPRS